MNRMPVCRLALAAALASGALGLASNPAWAQAATPAKAAAKPAPKPASKPAARPAAKSSTSKQKLDSEAKGLALASETVETITTSQLDIAGRVMTGDAQCEFNQTVKIEPAEGKPGHFNVAFKTARYVMVPEETTTGAVRLTDKKAGVVWLQIPFKSMLMNAKVGQRLVDSCLLAEQRAATSAAAAAGANTPAVLLTGPNQPPQPVLVVTTPLPAQPAEVIAVIPAPAAAAASAALTAAPQSAAAASAAADVPPALVITPSTPKP